MFRGLKTVGLCTAGFGLIGFIAQAEPNRRPSSVAKALASLVPVADQRYRLEQIAADLRYHLNQRCQNPLTESFEISATSDPISALASQITAKILHAEFDSRTRTSTLFIVDSPEFKTARLISTTHTTSENGLILTIHMAQDYVPFMNIAWRPARK